MLRGDAKFEAAKEAVRESLRIGENELRLTVSEAALVELTMDRGYADILTGLLKKARTAGATDALKR